MGDEFLLEYDEVKDRKGNEISMKGFAIKASMSEIITLGEGVSE